MGKVAFRSERRPSDVLVTFKFCINLGECVAENNFMGCFSEVNESNQEQSSWNFSPILQVI